MSSLSKEELITFEILLVENRDSAKLQHLTKCSYLESINLLNKVRKIQLDLDLKKGVFE